MTESTYRPYRIVVFALVTRNVGRGKRQKSVSCRCGFVAWTPEQHYQEARLPGAGSFCWPGIHAARAEALRQLSEPTVCQVSIRTNQDRPVYRYFKHTDGTITGYADSKE